MEEILIAWRDGLSEHIFITEQAIKKTQKKLSFLKGRLYEMEETNRNINMTLKKIKEKEEGN
jgi:uncharacterized coiled-coil protein SlyX